MFQYDAGWSRISLTRAAASALQAPSQGCPRGVADCRSSFFQGLNLTCPFGKCGAETVVLQPSKRNAVVKAKCALNRVATDRET